jgi:drug/metabolite transporter (DMT)-like permease
VSCPVAGTGIGNDAVNTRQWVLFWALGLIWGSSFLWIKIGVRELDPFTLVGWRLLFGTWGMVTVVLWQRPRFPRETSIWLALALLGIVNTALPFVLITWGEKSIDSAVASVLNSTMPLFTLVIAHLFLHDEPITARKAFGLLIGFCGVLILMARDLEPGSLRLGLLGQGAVLLAAVSYASAAVFARGTMRNVSPMVQAFVPMAFADMLVWSIATQAGDPGRLPSLAHTWIALLWLGLLGSCVAYLIYYSLLHTVGATRASMVTYVFPVVGVALGVLFLGERADWHLLAGAGLVISSIAVVNWRPKAAALTEGHRITKA